MENLHKKLMLKEPTLEENWTEELIMLELPLELTMLLLKKEK